MKTIFLALIATTVLGGCTTMPGECNPANRDVSMLTKMRCDGSGGYRSEIDRKEVDLVQAREENALFHQVFNDIETQRLAVRKSVDQQRASQSALVASTNQLLATLKARSGTDTTMKRQLAQAQADLKALQTKPLSASASVDDQKAKQAQLQTLQQTVLRLQASLGYTKK